MISRNMYIDDFAKRFVFYKQNSLCRKLTERISKIDPVIDFNKFRKHVSEEIIERGKCEGKPILCANQYGEEGFWYGHRQILEEYCGIKSERYKYLISNIVHGVDFMGYGGYTEDFIYSMQVLIMMSDYGASHLRKIRPWLQIYPIGPYILYVDGYYNKAWIEENKKKNKRTALYFPAHSSETMEIDFEKDAIKKNMDFLTDNYDTIIVCVYWLDIDNPVYKYYEDRGAKLVSSGIRSDANFLRRQRSLYEMCDDVYSNGIGTNMGYAFSLGKPYYFFDDRAKVLKHHFSEGHMSDCDIVERQIRDIWRSQNESEKRKIVEKYWGKERYFRTKEDMARIVKIQEKILSLSKGNLNKTDEIVKNVAEEKKSYGFSSRDIAMIKESIGI